LARPAAQQEAGKPVEETREHPAVKRARKGRRSLTESLSMTGLADIDFDPPRVQIGSKAADFDGSAAETTDARCGAGRE
ncbi:MAG: hypothetical protein OXF57_01180, partial [Rhodospirillaceae bacterium]|nr:hypothetical protein [Rhodospirillaceae bacterium]